MIGIVFSLVLLGAVVFALVDIILRDQSQIKHLPKVAWVLLVVFLPLIGTGLWFFLGREYTSRPTRPSYSRDRTRAQNPHLNTGSGRGSGDPRSTEQQLADLEREIELHSRPKPPNGDTRDARAK